MLNEVCASLLGVTAGLGPLAAWGARGEGVIGVGGGTGRGCDSVGEGQGRAIPGRAPVAGRYQCPDHRTPWLFKDPCSNFLCPFRLRFRFPSVLFGLASLLTSEIRFQLPDFLSLGSMRVALTRLLVLPWRQIR